ncbi:MAG: hypothetical protein AAF433_22090 [Bacteroidota bacterium]
MQIQNRLILGLVLLLAVNTNLILAQSISGQVRSAADAQPLQAAYVYPLANPGLVTLTDSLGHFQMELAQADTLLISYLGFEQGSSYAQPGDHALQIDLQPTAAASSQAVTVKARRIPLGATASQRISQLDIYLNPASKADPLLAVNSLPAATNPDETANVSLRGSPSEATGIYLNGVPIRSAVRLDQSNGIGQFSIFGQFPLEEMRVYPAHPPLSFSQASAGAVGLETSDLLVRQQQFGLSLNLVGLGLSYAQPVGEKSSVRAFVNATNVALFRGLNGDRLLDFRRSSALDGAVQFLHQFSDRFKLQAFYLGFRENYQFRTRSFYYEGDFQQTKDRHIAILNWRWRRGRWRLAFDQSLDWDDSQFSIGNIQIVPQQLNGYAALNARHEGRGASHQIGLLFNSYQSQFEGRSPALEYAVAPGDSSIAFTDQDDYQLLELYSLRQWRLGDYWMAEAGLRPAYLLGQQEVRLSVQANLIFRPSTKHRFSLGGGQFQQWLGPGPSIANWQWLNLRQLALEYQYKGPEWYATFALFHKAEDYELTGPLTVRGSEALIGFRTSSIRSWLSVTSVLNQNVAGIPTRRDLPFLVRGQFQWNTVSGWSIGSAFSWRRGVYFLPLVGRELINPAENAYRPLFAAANAGERYPNYLRMDLSLSKMYQLGKGQLILYLNINNLLDRQNVASYRYPDWNDGAQLDPNLRERNTYSRRLLFIGGVYQWARSK